MTRKSFSKFENAEELKDYLDKPFSHITKSVFHYTNLNALFHIFNDKKIKFSKFDTSNDITELKFVNAETKNKRYICFMGTMVENFGMWAMYGGLTKNKQSDLKDVYVKIEVPVTALKRLVESSGFTATRVAYTNIVKPGKQIYFCGSVQNNTGIPADNKLLSGYVKDSAWKYEQEIRIWGKDDCEFAALSDDFLRSLKIIPSPLYSIDECKELLKTAGFYDTTSILPEFVKNDYEGQYLSK